jgi:cytoskeletal protein RodZ
VVGRASRDRARVWRWSAQRTAVADDMDAKQDLGSYLCAERQLRQISLREVAEATKIPLHSLELLERGCWDELPGEVFLRGFVCSYARHLGIAEEAYDRFHQAQVLTERREAARSEPVGEAATAVGTRQRFGLALFVIILLIIVTITFSLVWGVGPHASAYASVDRPVSRLAVAPDALHPRRHV